MKKSVLSALLEGDPYLVTSQNFFLDVYLGLLEQEKHNIVVEVLDLIGEVPFVLMAEQSGVQEGFRLRHQRRSLLLATWLIDEQGNLDKSRLNSFTRAWEKSSHIVFPDGESDGKVTRRWSLLLRRLKEERSFWQEIERFHVPLCHRGAEGLVRSVLSLEENAVVSEADLKRAVLSSCFATLRQNVGSCFATAPAILIHEEQIDHYLQDLFDLLMTGRLTRIFAGVEYTVPLSISTGVGDWHKKVSFSEGAEEKPWCAPGLIEAFIAAGLIDGGESLREESERLRLALLSKWGHTKEAVPIEELLERALLERYELTRKEIEEFEKRQESKAALHPHASLLKGSQDKNWACEEFFEKREKAREAFKSRTDHLLLKAWEFTLASFADVKMKFSNWNLYQSLGFDPEEPGGIGSVLYRGVETKLQECNEKIQEYHRDYEIAYDQVRYVEARMKQATTAAEVRTLKAEHQSRAYHMNSCLEMRNRFRDKAEYYSKFFSFLIEQYTEKFQEYFQELYDPEMLDVDIDEYDDSPAGFRLVYKHGRKDPLLWTPITNEEQYSASLSDFFQISESSISAALDEDEYRKELGELTTAVILHVKTEEFIQSAQERMGKGQMKITRDPRQTVKKPWAYTSGGSMNQLLKTYCKRENEMTLESKWVEKPIDLLVFFLDTFKALPPSVTEPFTQLEDRSMLMNSPTHAFLLQPGWKLFRKGWEDNGFSYTWARDNVFAPMQQFFAEISLDVSDQAYLLDRFLISAPPLLAHRMRMSFSFSAEPIGVKAFAEEMINTLLSLIERAGERHRLFLSARVDHFLYSELPLLPGPLFKQKLYALLADFSGRKVEKTVSLLPDVPLEVVGQNLLLNAAKACALDLLNSPLSPLDLHRRVLERAREEHLAPPMPLLFADTNWTDQAFAFVVSPSTEELSLWRTDFIGAKGSPMISWEPYLDGRVKKTWDLYTHPHEYLMS